MNCEAAMNKHRIAFSVLKSARAFLESAVGFLCRGAAEERNFAILHLATSLELLIKAVVAAEDPNWLVAGSKPVSDDAFARGDFKSISFDRAINLLTASRYVRLTPCQVQHLTALRHMRNRVTHFLEAGDDIETRSVLGAGIHLFIEIYTAGFIDDRSDSGKWVRDIATALNQCEEFVHERLEHLASSLQRAERLRTCYFSECSNCLQDAAVIECENLTCLFCGSSETISACAGLVSQDGSVEMCPACSRLSVAYHRWEVEEPTYECICCGYFRGPELRWSDAQVLRVEASSCGPSRDGI